MFFILKGQKYVITPQEWRPMERLLRAMVEDQRWHTIEYWAEHSNSAFRTARNNLLLFTSFGFAKFKPGIARFPPNHIPRLFKITPKGLVRFERLPDKNPSKPSSQENAEPSENG